MLIGQAAVGYDTGMLTMNVKLCSVIIVTDSICQLIGEPDNVTIPGPPRTILAHGDGGVIAAFYDDGRLELVDTARETGLALYRLTKQFKISSMSESPVVIRISMAQHTITIMDDMKLSWTGNQSLELKLVQDYMKHFANAEVMA
jgi:hypothetical protein